MNINNFTVSQFNSNVLFVIKAPTYGTTCLHGPLFQAVRIDESILYAVDEILNARVLAPDCYDYRDNRSK